LDCIPTPASFGAAAAASRVRPARGGDRARSRRGDGGHRRRTSVEHPYGRFLVWAYDAEIIVGGCECTTVEPVDDVARIVTPEPLVGRCDPDVEPRR
jgi:hypothetical protein